MYVATRNKTISISDGAYSKLYKLKGKNESFTDVINRLTKRTHILDLAGVLSNSETKAMKSAVAGLRKESEKRMSDITEKMRRK